MNFEDFTYDSLSHLQIGRIGEYWVKICLTLYGFDTYYCDVDDKGIDFILRLNDSKHIDIQVKTIRENTNYVFVSKNAWNNNLRTNLYMALVILKNNSTPSVYFIPSKSWEKPDELLKNREYNEKGQTSKPEWGINISKKNHELLSKYNSTVFVSQVKNYGLTGDL